MSDTPETTAPLPPEAQGIQAARGKLEGRRILVVGAGTQASEEAGPPPGNGRAIALSCAREGASVACVDKNEAAAQDTRAQIQRDGGRAVVAVADVSDANECRRIVSSRMNSTSQTRTN